MFSKGKIASAAQEIADHIRLVEHVKALQEGQKSLSAGVAALNDRIRSLEQEMIASKAETKLEALKEAQAVVFAVQEGLSQRLQDLAVKMATLEIATVANSAPAKRIRASRGA